MSIVNGALDRQFDILATVNLKDNPFIKTEPPEHLLERVFVGRAHEMHAAARRVVDRPRNLLVYGGYGCGKTTFIRKLLSELRVAKRIRFLTGYAPLRTDTPFGFQIAALSALAEGALTAVDSGPFHDFARATYDEIGRLSLSGDELGAPDIRFRRGIELAHAAGFARVVLAIDEIDKRDAPIVRDLLLGSRHFLDLDAAFVLTGRYMDVFADVRSSLLAVFDHRIELPPFSDAESREIIRRNLAVARVTPESPETFRPFDEDVVERMVGTARGLPRPLNLMANAALADAVDQAIDEGLAACAVTLRNLERALDREGSLIYDEVGAESRELLVRMFRRKGYASGADLNALAPRGGLPAAVRELELLSREDAVLRLEAADGPAFALSPSVEQRLRALVASREKLKALWAEARGEGDQHTRAKALEAFACELFGETFVVTKKNLRTDTEEIDLVLERSPETDPRFNKGIYLPAECKNWRAQRVDQAVISKLAGEMGMHRMVQGFVVTTGTFTEDAVQQARYAAAAMNIEIVLLDGPTLESFLDDVRPVRDLLIDEHRRQVLRSS